MRLYTLILYASTDPVVRILRGPFTTPLFLLAKYAFNAYLSARVGRTLSRRQKVMSLRGFESYAVRLTRQVLRHANFHHAYPNPRRVTMDQVGVSETPSS